MKRCADACKYGSNLLETFDTDNRRITHKLEGPLFFVQDNAYSKAKLILSGIERIRGLAESAACTPQMMNEMLGRLANLEKSVSDIELEAKDGKLALAPLNIAKAIAAAHHWIEQPKLQIDGTWLNWRYGEWASWEPLIDLGALPD